MRVTLVGSTDLPELLPLVRAYCDFYQVTPSDQELLALSRALLADPKREGLQLLARDDASRAIGFATLYWTWQTLVAARVGVMNDLFVAPEALSQPRSCPPRPGSTWRRVSCGKSGGAPAPWSGGSMPPGAGGFSGHSTARALPSTAGATSSCPGPVPSRRFRCSALGSGDGASWRSPGAAEAA